MLCCGYYLIQGQYCVTNLLIVNASFLWRDFNEKLFTSRSLGRVLYRDVSQQFFIGPDRFVICDIFPVSFRWIYCYNKMGKSTCSCLDVSACLGLLQYWHVYLWNTRVCMCGAHTPILKKAQRGTRVWRRPRDARVCSTSTRVCLHVEHTRQC